MVKLTDIIKNFYSKTPYKRSILIIMLIILFICIGVYSYNKVAIPMAENKDSVNISNANRRIKIADIFFFNASWCPHCTKALPAWKDFVESYDKTIVNGYTINCIGGSEGVDCSTTDDSRIMELIQIHKVEHYPTLKMVKDKITIDFDAKITQENLTKFVNSVL